jgi:dolichyl-phosphate-mannose--protein O-mannosyl transferase
VEVLVLLLSHVGWREFLAWDVQIGPVILGGLHCLQVGGILLYVMSHMLMSTIWDVIPYQHLSHGSWVLCFLTPHLVPINIYLCSLVIFVRVSTTKVTESCSLKSWFMLGLEDSHVRTGTPPTC